MKSDSLSDWSEHASCPRCGRAITKPWQCNDECWCVLCGVFFRVETLFRVHENHQDEAEREDK